MSDDTWQIRQLMPVTPDVAFAMFAAADSDEGRVFATSFIALEQNADGKTRVEVFIFDRYGKHAMVRESGIRCDCGRGELLFLAFGSSVDEAAQRGQEILVERGHRAQRAQEAKEDIPL